MDESGPAVENLAARASTRGNSVSERGDVGVWDPEAFLPGLLVSEDAGGSALVDLNVPAEREAG